MMVDAYDLACRMVDDLFLPGPIPNDWQLLTELRVRAEGMIELMLKEHPDWDETLLYMCFASSIRDAWERR